MNYLSLNTMQEFFDKIRQLICELYECNYYQPLTVRKLNIGYQVLIPLSATDRPYSISIEAEGEKFWQILKQELQTASLNTIDNMVIQLNGESPTKPHDIYIE